MSKKLAVVLAEDMYECLELHYPRLRLIEAGYDVKVVGPAANATYKSKEGYWAKSTDVVADIKPSDVSVLVIPGGFCTDRLRRLPEMCDFVKQCDASGAVIGFICHAGWLAVSAKILSGRKVTCFFAIKDDLINAGANYVDERCVVDGKLVSAQTPDDLPAFMAAILAADK
jgi:protease I